MPPPRQSAPTSSCRTPGRARSIVASRSASAGRVRPARRAAAKTASCATRMPPPNAATSGIHESPGREAGRDRAVVGEDRDDRVGERAPGEQAEHAGDDGHDQRLAGDQPPDLMRRGAERAQHGDLAPPLRDGERERAGDDEQRDRAGDPAHRPEDRDERRAVGGARVAGVGVGRVVAVEDLEGRRGGEPAAARRARRGGGRRGGGRVRRGAAAASRDGAAMALTSPACPTGGRRLVGEEERRRAGRAADGAGDAERRLARGRRDAHPRAGGQPLVGDHLARAGRRASRGQAVGRQRGARPAVGVQRPGAEAAAARPRADRERDVPDAALDARDERGVEPRRGHRRIGAVLRAGSRPRRPRSDRGRARSSAPSISSPVP